MQPTVQQTAPEATLGAYVRANFKTIAVVLIIGFLLAVVFYQKQSSKLPATQAAATSSPKADASVLRQKIAAIVEIPTNETPTIATVDDPSKLKNQQFFANAKAGDKVVMFANAKEVVLYRPTTGKVVQIAPINLGSDATASSTLTAGK